MNLMGAEDVLSSYPRLSLCTHYTAACNRQAKRAPPARTTSDQTKTDQEKKTAPKTKKKPDPKPRRDPEVGRDPHPDSYTSYIPYIYIYPGTARVTILDSGSTRDSSRILCNSYSDSYTSYIHTCEHQSICDTSRHEHGVDSRILSYY